MTTQGRYRAMALAVTLGAVALTSACNNPEPGTVVVTPSPSSTSVTPTTTATSTATREEKNAKAASAAVVEFWAVVDRLGSNPKSKLEDLATVSRDPANAQWTQNLFNRRIRGEKFIGSTTVTIESSKPATSAEDVYTVMACLDVSKLNVVDAEGKSVIPATRKPRISYQYEVKQDSSTAKWYLTAEKAGTEC